MSSETTDQKADWFYLAGEQTRGPFTVEELKTFFTAGKISGDTYVCREGMKGWVQISSLAEFKIESQKTIAVPKKTNQNSKFLIGVGVLLIIGIVAVSGWYYGIHEPKMRNLAQEAEQQRERDLQEAKAKAEVKKREEQATEEKLQAEAKKEEEERQEQQRAQKAEAARIEEIGRQITIERTSLNGWLDYVQRVLAMRNMTANIDAAHKIAVVLEAVS